MGKRFRSVNLPRQRHLAVWAVSILRRHLPDPTPVERLWLAVIEQAVREAYAGVPGDPQRQDEARAWLQSDHFTELAVSLGLHPYWARDTIGKLDRLGRPGDRRGASFPCGAVSRVSAGEGTGGDGVTWGARRRLPKARCRSHPQTPETAIAPSRRRRAT